MNYAKKSNLVNKGYYKKSGYRKRNAYKAGIKKIRYLKSNKRAYGKAGYKNYKVGK